MVHGIINEVLLLPPATANQEPSAAKDQTQGQGTLPKVARATELTTNSVAGNRRALKLREPGFTFAEYEQQLAAYELDFSRKRAHSDDDTGDERLWVPRKKSKRSTNAAQQEEGAAPAQSQEGFTVSSTDKASPARRSPSKSLTSQSVTAESSGPKKRSGDDMDREEEDNKIGSQAKRRKTATSKSSAPQLDTPSATNLGFATNHSPIRMAKIARISVATRSWLFPYRSEQGFGVYRIKCPKSTCQHAFQEHPLLEHRARDHFQQCGFVSANEQQMMQECAQQGELTLPQS